ncbi:hypothetical protein ERO13_D06G159450v2 [Gossypium hirsutum]|nr:hypothetical protein ERO13_D06G159450v2 [Gossypium hirsutum]
MVLIDDRNRRPWWSTTMGRCALSHFGETMAERQTSGRGCLREKCLLTWQGAVTGSFRVATIF